MYARPRRLVARTCYRAFSAEDSKISELLTGPGAPPQRPSLGRLRHVALAVPCVRSASAIYRDALGATVSAPRELPEHGVITVFVSLPNADIELLEPLGPDSPIAAFLEKNPAGGMHHICLSVPDLRHALSRAQKYGLRIIGGLDGVKIGAHGNPVSFLHPKDTGGTMIELEQESSFGED
jgi:methylmalonyl-CoA/ethylmalonyl-CoA epimerase